jgi:hypothetical protein
MIKFWMVFVEEGNAPTFKHDEYDGALRESKRLAETLNKKTYVLEAITSVELTKFQVTNLVEASEIAF